MTASEPIRGLTKYEQAVLGRLLEVPFPGCAELKEQLEHARFVRLGPDGSPALVFTVPRDLPGAQVRRRIPVEAEAPDRDGMLVHFLLHVVDGQLAELEVFREDGEPIQQMPGAASLSVVPA